MPPYWRPRYYSRWRRRRLWRRRPQRFVRRRLWRKRRHRRYRVRKLRKLKYLHLKEWQPRRIVKLKCKGTLPLYITTNDRVSFNLREYENEITPHYVPGLGGYSITNFTLGALYQLHQQGRCFWTHSNDDLPFIRYTGCTMYFYRSESSDYIINYHNCGPLIPNLLTFNSAQPSIMQLNNRHKIIRCKSKNYSKKPYTKVKIKPPSNMTNQWFLQRDFADTQLLLLMASGMSLDRYYIHSNSISNTIGFTSLNTNFFQMHDFYQTTTTGYYPKQNTYLWTYQQSNPKPTKIQDIKIKNMIFLGNTNKADPGTTINDVPKGNSQTFKHQIDTYIQNNGYWGNIFISAYLKGPQPILYSTSHPRTLLKSETYYKDSGDTTLQEADFKQVTEKFLINCRYNPFPDTGKDNKIYFTDITSQQHNWDPPEDQTLQNNNFPLWIGLFGLTDWAKLTKTAELIDTKRVLTLSSKYISSNLKTIVPIDEDVLNGVSPFRKDISGSDSLFWHPKTSFQYKVINNIAACGPGTLKLPPNVSAEGHVKFCFYFKLGGCTQPKRTIEDPEKQPIVASTNNILQSNSLQNPYQSIESYLFPFDWRRDFLTKSALERIKKHKEPETTLFESTGVNLFVPKVPTETTSETDSSNEEEEKETLHLLLRHLRKQRQQYEHRILQLINSK